MSAIVYDINSLMAWAERDDDQASAEFKEIIRKELQYVQEQSKGLRADSKKYLIYASTKRIIEAIAGYEHMIDGRENQQPF